MSGQTYHFIIILLLYFVLIELYNGFHWYSQFYYLLLYDSVINKKLNFKRRVFRWRIEQNNQGGLVLLRTK